MKNSKLSLLRGSGLKIGYGDKEVINPTLSMIEELEKEIGEGTYLNYIYSLISSSKDIADVLYCESNIWYEDINNEWDFFIQKCWITGKEKEILFPNIDKNIEKDTEDDFVQVKVKALDGIYLDSLNYFLGTNGDYIFWNLKNKESKKEETVLVNVEIGRAFDETSFKLTEINYYKIVEFLKEINWIKIEYDFLMGGSDYAKKYILKQRYKKRSKKQKTDVDLNTIVSSIIAKSGMYKEIWDIPIYAIYDIYYRLVKIEEYNNTMSALYSNNIDTSKNPINWEKINWSSSISI